MSIKIFIADDHPIFRSGLRAFLEKDERFEIVGESGDGHDTIGNIIKNDVDVLILDINMPGPPVVKVVEEILNSKPEICIVILTMHEEEYYFQELLKKGIRAFVLKKSTDTNLINAITETAKGNFFIDPAMTKYMVSSFTGKYSKKSDKTGSLTKREIEVFKLVALGFTNNEIGEKLSISKNTVETHKVNLKDKLGLKTRADLVRFALDNNYIQL